MSIHILTRVYELSSVALVLIPTGFKNTFRVFDVKQSYNDHTNHKLYHMYNKINTGDIIKKNSHSYLSIYNENTESWNNEKMLWLDHACKNFKEHLVYISHTLLKDFEEDKRKILNANYNEMWGFK